MPLGKTREEPISNHEKDIAEVSLCEVINQLNHDMIYFPDSVSPVEIIDGFTFKAMPPKDLLLDQISVTHLKQLRVLLDPVGTEKFTYKMELES